MQALWHINSKESKVQSGELPTTPSVQLQIQSLFSLISTGTELTIAKGQVPREIHTEMRVPYMEGEFLFPVKYGYSLVGQNPATGTVGHIMHPHQSECMVDPDDFFQIPADIPPKRATLAAHVETALTGVWDGEVKPGDRIAIVGFGLIGSLVARIAQGIPGTAVHIIETHPGRIEIAQMLGFNVDGDLRLPVEPFDIAFHCSGTQEGLLSAINSVGMEGRIIEMSWYGNREVSVFLGGNFHIMRKQIISSQVSNIPGAMQNRWDHRRRKQVVFALLKNPAFDTHITHEVSLQEAAELFNHWRSTPPTGLSYCIKY